jgi:hypothetical protein
MKKDEDEILYEDVFRALNKAKINYAVCGGLAVILYGYARLTMDLDLILDLSKNNLGKLFDALIKLDYRIKIPISREYFICEKKLKGLEQTKNMKVVSFYHLKDSMKLIDIGVNLPCVAELLERKKYIKIKDINVPIISIDDLIKMKGDLARPRDLIDVENLKKIKKEKRC